MGHPWVIFGHYCFSFYPKCGADCSKDMISSWFLELLTTKSVQAGTTKSRLRGFWLAKHTAHKHPHHDGAICLSSSMVFMAEYSNKSQYIAMAINFSLPLDMI
jgi:hypothetical protein